MVELLFLLNFDITMDHIQIESDCTGSTLDITRLTVRSGSINNITHISWPSHSLVPRRSQGTRLAKSTHRFLFLGHFSANVLGSMQLWSTNQNQSITPHQREINSSLYHSYESSPLSSSSNILFHNQNIPNKQNSFTKKTFS